MRIARQDSLVELLLGRDVRKVSQVRVQHDRTDHLHDIRSLCTGSILPRIGPSRLLRGPGALGLGKHARRLKKADFEVDFFFIDRAELFPSAVNPRRVVEMLGEM